MVRNTAISFFSPIESLIKIIMSEVDSIEGHDAVYEFWKKLDRMLHRRVLKTDVTVLRVLYAERRFQGSYDRCLDPKVEMA